MCLAIPTQIKTIGDNGMATVELGRSSPNWQPFRK